MCGLPVSKLASAFRSLLLLPLDLCSFAHHKERESAIQTNKSGKACSTLGCLLSRGIFEKGLNCQAYDLLGQACDLPTPPGSAEGSIFGRSYALTPLGGGSCI